MFGFINPSSKSLVNTNDVNEMPRSSSPSSVPSTRRSTRTKNFSSQGILAKSAVLRNTDSSMRTDINDAASFLDANQLYPLAASTSNISARTSTNHNVIRRKTHLNTIVTGNAANTGQPYKPSNASASSSSILQSSKTTRLDSCHSLVQRHAEFDEIADWDVLILCTEQTPWISAVPPSRRLLLSSKSAPLPINRLNSSRSSVPSLRSSSSNVTNDKTADLPYWPNSRSQPAYTQSAFELGQTRHTAATTTNSNNIMPVLPASTDSTTALHSSSPLSSATSQPTIRSSSSSTFPHQTVSSTSQQISRQAPTRQIRARKSVLSEHSPVLARILDEYYNPEVKTVIINDNADVFDAVNFFLHFGFVDYLRAFNTEQLLQLWQRALKYEIVDLARHCVRRLIKTVDADSAMNCIDVVEQIIVLNEPRMLISESSKDVDDEIRLIAALESFVTLQVLRDETFQVRELIRRAPCVCSRVMQRVLDQARQVIPKARWQTAMVDNVCQQLVDDGFDPFRKTDSSESNNNEVSDENFNSNSVGKEEQNTLPQIGVALCNLQ